MITPAISVLSAVEGLKLAAPALEHYRGAADGVHPRRAVLGAAQRHGACRVRISGRSWWSGSSSSRCSASSTSATIPSVLAAINPYYGIQFLLTHGTIGLVTLGAVFLAVTGGEALYADLGHFGRKPIQSAWIFFVLPALLINYFGQGALVLSDPERDRKLVLPHGAGSAAAAAGGAGDGRDRDREPGGHHRRFLAGPAGRSARLVAALRGPLHLRDPCRADLSAARQPAAADRRAAARVAVPHLQRAGVGLWHRGFHHHGRATASWALW